MMCCLQMPCRRLDTLLTMIVSTPDMQGMSVEPEIGTVNIAVHIGPQPQHIITEQTIHLTLDVQGDNRLRWCMVLGWHQTFEQCLTDGTGEAAHNIRTEQSQACLLHV